MPDVAEAVLQCVGLQVRSNHHSGKTLVYWKDSGPISLARFASLCSTEDGNVHER